MAQRFLVTGGAGYVGSHLVLALVERGDSVVVIDNLRTGHRAAVPDGAQLAVIDLADTNAVDALLAEGPWDAVFHFASLTQVGESMRLPFRYLIDNGANGMRLIEACVRHGVSRFVLSSTCAVYGTPETVPIPEDAPQNPELPYGEGKRIIEARAVLGGPYPWPALRRPALFQRRGRRPERAYRRGSSPGDASHPAGDRCGAWPARRTRRGMATTIPRPMARASATTSM